MSGTAVKTEPAQVRSEPQGAHQRLSAVPAPAPQHRDMQPNLASGEHHDDALTRLEAAMAEQTRRRYQYDAASDTSGEPIAFARVCEANEWVSTRRTWLRWVDQHHHY
jgi:hypothetical protein